MPVREESFRIGCGRYIQKPGALTAAADEVLRLGTGALILGGPTALSLTQKELESSLSAQNVPYLVCAHAGTCNEQNAAQFAALARERKLDVIVGVGGGVIMDFAKLVGDQAHLPVLNIPTSSATCAAYTPLSVRYTPEGRTVGSLHYGYEVGGVLVDTQVVSTQPERLLLSGVFDALAKFVEIRQRFSEEQKTFPLGLDWAYVMSQRSFGQLCEKTEECIRDMKAGRMTDTVEQVVFATIAATGVISGIARGSNQCALAHKFYETTRAMFFEESRSYLHGEIVGVGLLLQNHFNGEVEHNDFLLSMMKKYRMPGSVSGIGVAPTEEHKKLYFQKLTASSAMEGAGEAEKQRLQAALDYLWEIG